jgi:pyrimidine-nucleoside phosphorylase
LKTPYELITWKKQGGEHSAEEIAALVDAITDGSIPEYQLAAWLMAVWFRGMSVEETYQLTDRMASSGIRLDLSELDGPTADKHSTGGVGDKVSLLLAPLAAELGLLVPMLSGRGLGHTGGTLDKLQSIPGYRIDLSPSEFLKVVGQVGCSITGQTGQIAPADRRLYHLRDVTATVDCVPLIVSSILSKKIAAGPANLVIDLKCGSGAFMRDPESARTLAESLLATAKRAGRQICALVTDMGQPLGSAVGHALEAREAIAGLSGEGPAELRTLTVELTAAMGELAGLGSLEDLKAQCARHLDDGSALARFLQMVHAHGGRMDESAPADCLSIAPEHEPLSAERGGWVQGMNAEEIGLSLVELGGARRRSDDELDLGVGLEVLVRVGDKVDQGQPLARIFARDENAAAACRQRLKGAMPVSEEKCTRVPLIFERVG